MPELVERATSSSAALPQIGPETNLADALALLDAAGALVIQGALGPAALEDVRAQLAPWFTAAPAGEGDFFGRRTRRFGGLFAKAPGAAILALHPLVAHLIDRTLRGSDPERPRCDVTELNLAQAIAIEPGERAQLLHRDEILWPWRPDFEVMANVMWALDDFTDDNGATRLVVGSHRWPRERRPIPEEIAAACAPAGSAIVWLGGTLHGGGANRSSHTRRGVVVSWRLGWLAPAERMLLSVPPEAARRLPTELQRMVGYQVHCPNLGWVEGRDPIEWLRGEIGQVAPARDNLRAADAVALALALAETSG